MFFEYPDRFDNIPGGTKYIRDLTVVNILPVTILTAEILKQMVPRNKGVVINISSSASYHTMRYINVYSATKVIFKFIYKAAEWKEIIGISYIFK